MRNALSRIGNHTTCRGGRRLIKIEGGVKTASREYGCTLLLGTFRRAYEGVIWECLMLSAVFLYQGMRKARMTVNPLFSHVHGESLIPFDECLKRKLESFPTPTFLTNSRSTPTDVTHLSSFMNSWNVFAPSFRMRNLQVRGAIHLIPRYDFSLITVSLWSFCAGTSRLERCGPVPHFRNGFV